jgi:hypothetical protein
MMLPLPGLSARGWKRNNEPVDGHADDELARAAANEFDDPLVILDLNRSGFEHAWI